MDNSLIWVDTRGKPHNIKPDYENGWIEVETTVGSENKRKKFIKRVGDIDAWLKTHDILTSKEYVKRTERRW